MLVSVQAANEEVTGEVKAREMVVAFLPD